MDESHRGAATACGAGPPSRGRPWVSRLALLERCRVRRRYYSAPDDAAAAFQAAFQGGALRCHCAGSDASPQRSSAVSAAVTEQVQLSQTAPHAAQQSLSIPHSVAHELLCSYRTPAALNALARRRTAAHSHQLAFASALQAASFRGVRDQSDRSSGTHAAPGHVGCK